MGGLPGLLLSQGNAGRTEPLDVLGPRGLCEVVDGLLTIARSLPFVVRCRELAAGDTFSLGELAIATAAGDHAVPCLAYRLDVPRQRRFLEAHARALGIPRAQWKGLQRGEPATVGTRTVQPEEVLGPPRRGVSLALATDTRPTDAIVRLIRGVDLFICEGTYGADEDQPRAAERRHLTFAEAAETARRARVRQLVLTHFSPALANPEQYAQRARDVFPNTVVGRDHLSFRLTFREEEARAAEGAAPVGHT